MKNTNIEIFDEQYAEARQAFLRKGFAEISMQKSYEENLCWSPLATWGQNMPDVTMWYGYWYPDSMDTPYIWIGFQGGSEMMRKIVSICFAVDGLSYDEKFTRFDLLKYERVQGKVVSERDDVWHYFGQYVFLEKEYSLSNYYREVAEKLDSVTRCVCDRDVERDISKIPATEREALILARRGQALFRKKLDSIWGNKCSATSCAVREVLRASHIKPWKQSSDQEKLDHNNGLLLTASLDALFDKGLISFDDNGNMIFADRLSIHDRQSLALDGIKLRMPLSEKQRFYMKIHRRMLE